MIYVFRSKRADRVEAAAVLGRHGAGAGGQAIGRGFVPLAELARWRDAADASTLVGAAGGPRLGAGAQGENDGAEGGFVITIICGETPYFIGDSDARTIRSPS